MYYVPVTKGFLALMSIRKSGMVGIMYFRIIMDSHGQQDFENTLEFPPKKKPEHMRSVLQIMCFLIKNHVEHQFLQIHGQHAMRRL